MAAWLWPGLELPFDRGWGHHVLCDPEPEQLQRVSNSSVEGDMHRQGDQVAGRTSFRGIGTGRVQLE